LKLLPKIIPTRKYKEKTKTWDCPNCKVEIKTMLKHREVVFIFKDREFAGCGGIYESVIILCPNCETEIEFTKEELGISV